MPPRKRPNEPAERKGKPPKRTSEGEGKKAAKKQPVKVTPLRTMPG